MTTSPPPTDTDRRSGVAARPVCDHAAWFSTIRGGEPVSVRLCSVCREPDWDDLRRQVEQIATRRAAEELEAAAGRPMCRPDAQRLLARAAALVAAHPDHTDNREERA